MSASDKKKLRKEQVSAILTERQRQEQAEAKKLKLYTISFIAVMAIIVCVAVGVLGYRAVTQSGVFEKNTIAAVVDGNELNTVEMSYYYNDAINEFYNELYTQYEGYESYYMQMMGLDPSKPLTEQTNPETGKPWSEYFLNTALENAKNDFALIKAAAADNFTLPEDDRETIETMLSNLDMYAQIYGFANADKYLQAMYGFGSTVKNYTAYTERCALADAYLTNHHDTLSFTKEDYREHEKDIVDNYNSYTYDTVYLSYTDFLPEDAAENSTEEQNNAAREALRLAAEQLATCTTLEELKAKLETVEVSEDSSLVVDSYENKIHTSINSNLAKWLADSARQDGELAAIENVSKDSEGKETLNGYYIAIFHSKRDNNAPMANVRHLLVKFAGGTTDETTKQTTYSDEEKAAAKEKADGYLKTWKEGKADEASFIELVKAHSEDTSAAEGGLFEDIHPDSQYVPNFLNWSIDLSRKAGDTEVIETEYGYHVMYYVGNDEMSYRDYMIDSELRDEKHEKWYEDILATVTGELKDTSRMRLDLTIGAA